MKFSELSQNIVFQVFVIALILALAAVGIDHPFGYRFIWALLLIFGLGTLMYRVLDKYKDSK